MSRSKDIGTRVESAVVKFIRANGFDGAERIALKGANDEGDVSFCPGVVAECKGGKSAEQASDNQIAAWLQETETERVARGADVAVLICKRSGKGAANAGQWSAWLPGWTYVQLVTGSRYTNHLPAVRITLAELCYLLRFAGYGTALPDSVELLDRIERLEA